MELLRIEEYAGLRIANKGVVGPTVPEARDHVEELAGTPIAFVVLDMLVEAEIERGIGIRRRHEIPSGTAAADMVERRETSGDVIRRVERGGRGCNESQPFRDRGQRGQQRQRFERGHRVAMLERVERHVEHREVVGHEERVEAATLERLREALQMREVEVGIGIGARIAPCAGMNGGRTHKSAEAKLT